jgi:hypothetical protein
MSRGLVTGLVVAVALAVVGVAVWDGAVTVNVGTSEPVERVDRWVLGDAMLAALDRAIERESEQEERERERERAESEPDSEPAPTPDPGPESEPVPAPEPADDLTPVPGESVEEYRERFNEYRERVPENIPENPGE